MLIYAFYICLVIQTLHRVFKKIGVWLSRYAFMIFISSVSVVGSPFSLQFVLFVSFSSPSRKLALTGPLAGSESHPLTPEAKWNCSRDKGSLDAQDWFRVQISEQSECVLDTKSSRVT